MNKNALNIAVLIALINCIFIFLAGHNLVEEQNFSDNGAVSQINHILLIIASTYCLWLGFSAFADKRLDWFYLAFIFQVYLMREADFHTAFTRRSLAQWENYTLPDIPLDIKLGSALIFLLLFMCISYLLARYLSAMLLALKKRTAWAVSTLIWGILIFISQFIDRKIESNTSPWQISAIEEMLEVGAAVFALLALIQFSNHYKHKYKDYFS